MKLLKARLKRAVKRYAHLQGEIEAGKRWQEEAHSAELLQSNLYRMKKGMESIEVEDWEQGGVKRILILDPLKEPAEQLKRQWRWSQKLKNKLKYSIQFAEATLKEIEKIEALLLQKTAEEADPETPKERVKPQTQKVKPKAHPFREFKTEKGLHIFIGKGAANNEKLTFSFAHGSDLWFHAANHSGCHLILRPGKDADEESIKDALQLTLFFSKVSEDDVTVTECKHLRRVKGAKQGLVSVGKHRTLFVKQDPERIAQIFSRSKSESIA